MTGLPLWTQRRRSAAVLKWLWAILRAGKVRRVDAWMREAYGCHGKGEVEKAEALYRRILKADPAHAGAWARLGEVLQQINGYTAAIDCYRKALAIEPGLPEVHNSLGCLLQAQGVSASTAQKKLSGLRPDFAEVGRRQNARDARSEEAIDHFRRAVEFSPDFAEAWTNLGNALAQTGEWGGAIESHRKALEIRPDFPEACFNLGFAIQGSGGALGEAIRLYQKALQYRHDDPEIYLNLALCLKETGDFDAAAECHDTALRLKPDFPEVQWNRSHLLLLKGDFQNGWPAYEMRWRVLGHLAEHAGLYGGKPRWDGGEAAGKTVLLYGEQGFGDALQFVRFVSRVKEHCAAVVLVCHRSLKRLFESVVGVSAVVVEGEPLPEHDLQLPLLSVPYVLKTRLESIPREVPYVAAPAEAAPKWTAKICAERGRLKVGLAWSGAKENVANFSKRSLRLSALAPLFQLPGIAFYSLQVGEAGAEARELAPGTAWVDLTSEIEDFGDTAGLISQLDLVISVDTAVAHLAGALGKPVWVLLPYVPDWRWLLGRTDSPWYPTMRLFRQQALGEWPGVVVEVEQALRCWAERGGA